MRSFQVYLPTPDIFLVQSSRNRSFFRKEIPMSEQNSPFQEVSQTYSPRKRCRWGCALIASLVLGSLAGVILTVLFMPQHEATVHIQVRAARPQFIVDHNSQQFDRPEQYGSFVQTQMALIRNPIVIDRVLENPAVARWDVVREQGANRREWLLRRLHIKHIANSQIVEVSVRTNSADVSEAIVNAVTKAYFEFVEETARRSNNELIGSLRVEEHKQRQLATTFQESIRRKTRESVVRGMQQGDGGMAVGIGLLQGEALVQEIVIAEVKLLTLLAQRRSIVELMNDPNKIPISILIQERLKQIQPELELLKGQKRVLTEQREELIQIFRDDDPRIVEFDQQIKLIDERENNLLLREGQEEILGHFRTREEMKLFELEREIRVQEILITELTSKHHGQLLKGVEHAESMLDVEFESSQLERTNKTLSLIEDRILAITTELRAPGQITLLSSAVSSIKPSPLEVVLIAGSGFLVFFFLPLLCMMCYRCCFRRK